jgi:hypothetical protein
VVYLFWLDALKLKLRADWVEPAHHRMELECKEWEWYDPSRDWLEPVHRPPIRRRCKRWGLKPPYWWDWLEPVHMTPDVPLVASPEPVPWRHKVVLLAVDQVYPELQLEERLAQRHALWRRWVPPEVMEPVHFREEDRILPREALQELVNVLRRRGY